ncbi:MAG: V-type ATP synthase subunit E [Nitrososphaerota archaeon]|nr:V-type ATP synthase subunit E [Nitrososphaerota archaeon]
MGLEEIVAKIGQDADEQAARITSDARDEAKKVVESARAQADSIISDAKAEAEREARAERLRSVAAARLAAKRELLQAREEVLSRYEDVLRKSVDDFMESDEYLGFLVGVIKDGVSKIGEGAVVHVTPEDRIRLKGKKLPGEMSEDKVDFRGGALVSSADGKRRVDNSIDSLLRERSDAIRLRLVEKVFGDGKSTA